MKPKCLATAGLLAAAVIALPVFAEDEHEATPPDAPMDVEREHDSAWSYLQAKYDANGDDAISPAEYDRSAEAFARLDRDDDGILAEQDFGILAEQDFGAGVRRPRGERGERRERPRGTPEGEAAPDFTLRPLHLDPELKLEEQLVTLWAFQGDRPVALIFGSYT